MEIVDKVVKFYDYNVVESWEGLNILFTFLYLTVVEIEVINASIQFKAIMIPYLVSWLWCVVLGFGPRKKSS